jgi:hypothetical protein
VEEEPGADHACNELKRGVQRRGRDWRRVDEMQEQVDAVGDCYAKVDPPVWK